MVRRSPRQDASLPDRLAENLPDDHEHRAAYERLLRALRNSGGRCTIVDLTRELVERDGPLRTSAPVEEYRSTFLALRRRYLPALVSLDIVEYDGSDGSVTLTDAPGPRRTNGS